MELKYLNRPTETESLAPTEPPPPSYTDTVIPVPTSQEPPKWVHRNLTACRVTVWVMWLVVLVDMTFATVMRNVLKDNLDSSNCAYQFIGSADEPWDRTSPFNHQAERRQHAQCQLLFHFSSVLIAAGSFTMFRPFLQIAPFYKPSALVVLFTPYDQRGHYAGMTSATRVHAIRTIFSAIPGLLYIVAFCMLAASRIFSDPADEETRSFWGACLAFVWVSAVVSCHQAFATGAACWYTRGEEAR